MNYKRFIIILILFFCLGCAYSQVGLKTDQFSNISKNRVDLFVMSQCPYSIETEKVIIPMIDQFRDKVDFKIYFIAYEANIVRERLENEFGEEDIIGDVGEEKCRGVPHIDPEAKFYSLHGQPEVDEDIRQLLIMKYYPEKFLDYLLYRAENYSTDDWEEAAAKAWIDIDHIRELIEQPDAEGLFRENIKRAYEMKIESSPTLLINGQLHKGRIDRFTLGRYVCKNSPRCKECKDIPVCGADQDCETKNKVGICLNPDTKHAKCQFSSPVKIQLTIIRKDGRSHENNDQIVSYSRSLFPKITIKELDCSEEQANALISKYDINVLPAYIYNRDVEESLRFMRIQDMLFKKEDVYFIKPKYLARANYIDRYEKEGQIDLFVESLSEAGNYIEKGLMTNSLFDDLKINVHFWAQKDEANMPDTEGHAVMTMSASSDQSNILYLAPHQPQITFKSGKGLAEIQEDIRQLLIAATEPQKYNDYLSCINEKILSSKDDGSWNECVKGAGIDSEILSPWHMNGKGVELLLADIALAEELDLESSPAVLIDNQILLRNFNLKILEQELLGL